MVMPVVFTNPGSCAIVIWPLTFAVTAVVSFVVGYVMHIFIEKPSLRIREWLAA